MTICWIFLILHSEKVCNNVFFVIVLILFLQKKKKIFLILNKNYMRNLMKLHFILIVKHMVCWVHFKIYLRIRFKFASLNRDKLLLFPSLCISNNQKHIKSIILSDYITSWIVWYNYTKSKTFFVKRKVVWLLYLLFVCNQESIFLQTLHIAFSNHKHLQE